MRRSRDQGELKSRFAASRDTIQAAERCCLFPLPRLRGMGGVQRGIGPQMTGLARADRTRMGVRGIAVRVMHGHHPGVGLAGPPNDLRATCDTIPLAAPRRALFAGLCEW